MKLIEIIVLIVFLLIIAYFSFLTFGIYSLKHFKNGIMQNYKKAALLSKMVIDYANYLNHEASTPITYDTQDLENKIQNLDINGVFEQSHKIFLDVLANCFQNGETKSCKILRDFEKEASEEYEKLLEENYSNVLGYNYWASLWIIRPFTKLLKYNQIEKIN